MRRRRATLARTARRMLAVAVLALIGRLTLPEALLERVLPTLHAVTVTLTNTNDSGDGSLRQAMTDAIALCNSPFSNRVSFDIPGGGVHTINLLAQLPDITCGLTIDGTTQPGYMGAPL